MSAPANVTHPPLTPVSTGDSAERDDCFLKRTVKVITATRLPAQHSRVVCPPIEGTGDLDNGVHLFKPELRVRELEGLNMPEAIVEPKEELHLVVTNHTGGPIQLSKGQMLG